MCGICGMVSRRPEFDRSVMDGMHAVLHHRGPDGGGELDGPHVALRVQRLSIIDPATGWQPLYNEDRSLALVANAEIYNFRELRTDLERRGHRLQTGSDCESILHLYEEWGEECVQRLRGMFAFALWDQREQTLLLARDRLGEKPLYLCERPGTLVFASELKALIAAGAASATLDPRSVHLYFHYGYVPEPATAIQGVRKLAAGHVLKVRIHPWQLTERQYWDAECSPAITDEPAERIRAELEGVGSLVTRADVPVGVALSGGLDSSAVAALCARQYSGDLHAFSVGYPGRPPHDERRVAQALAGRLGLPFREAELGTREVVEFFPELLYSLDEPVADLAAYAYYAVAKLARQHGVPVLLFGHGGDELFWGYSSILRAARESELKKQWLESGWRSLPHYLAFHDIDRGNPQGFRKWLQPWRRLRTAAELYWRHATSPVGQMVFYDAEPHFRAAAAGVRRLYHPDLRERLEKLGDGSAFRPFTFGEPVSHPAVRITRLILETYLRVNCMVQADRLTMASSVEARLPLVDYRLVETVIGLRKAFPDHWLEPKAWLRAALRGVLPQDVLARPKQGFAPPVLEWHRGLFERYGSLLPDGALVHSGVLNATGARELAQGEFPQGIVLPLSFLALALELWLRAVSGSQRAPRVKDVGYPTALADTPL